MFFPAVCVSGLINWTRQREQWDFFSGAKLLTLIGCLEDSTNEVTPPLLSAPLSSKPQEALVHRRVPAVRPQVRELSAGLLLRYFPAAWPEDVAALLRGRSRLLLCSPRVPQAQMGALMTKVMLHK